MKKILALMMCLILVPMVFADKKAAPDIQGHVLRMPNVSHVPYNGPRSIPTLLYTIDLSPVNPTGYCWGLAYDWERDCLWVTQWNSAYNKMYAIQKTAPCTKIDSVTLGSGVPGYRLGIGYGGSNVMYMAGYDGAVWAINMTTGNGSYYRSTPWSGDEGLDFNVVDDAVYAGDWGANACGAAQPAQSGSWTTWTLSSVSGLSGAHDASVSPEWLFTVNEDVAQAYFYQHSLTNGMPNTVPDSTWQLPAGMTMASTADMAFDGQYIYILDQSGPDAIWVFDVGIELGPIVWDFETGWQSWTHTNGQAFPAGWDVEASNIHPSQTPPDAGDSTMWIDSDASGGGYSDTALSPVLIPKANMDWLKYGICNYHFGGSTYINEVHVGLKYYTSGVWNAVELKLYPTSAPFGPAWDSVDVSSYATADFIQIYFYYTDLNTWGYWACFDNVSIDAYLTSHDVGVASILEPVGTYFLNDVVDPSVAVKNFGDFDETFDVCLTMTHNASVVYADSAEVSLASGVTDTVVFDSYTFAEAGAYDVLSYTIFAGDENPDNDTATAVANVYEGLIPYVIIDPDLTPLTGPYLNSKFQSWGLSGVYTTNSNVINADSLSLYQTAWICTGIYANYYPMTNEQATAIGTYLATGRKAYCEGGDAWGFVTSRTILCPLFGIDPNATLDGSADLYTVTGQANGQIPQVAGNNWSYTGENNWIDRLAPYASPPNGGTAEGFLWNAAISYWTGVAYDQGTWKTVALSHELAGDVAGTQPTDSLLLWIAQYFDMLGIEEQPVNNDVQAFGFAPRMSTLANDHVAITYSTTVQGHVSLQVYDGIGRLVQTLVNAEQPAGEKSLVWNRTDMNGRTVANGVYFFKLQVGNETATHKLVLVD